MDCGSTYVAPLSGERYLAYRKFYDHSRYCRSFDYCFFTSTLKADAFSNQVYLKTGVLDSQAEKIQENLRHWSAYGGLCLCLLTLGFDLTMSVAPTVFLLCGADGLFRL